MRFLADFHIHSPYSRATSKELTFPNLYKWGQIKGISLIGTGDCTHPAWIKAMHAQLEPDDAGLLKLRSEHLPDPSSVPADAAPVRFIITGEISCIYKAGGATRKVHNVVVLPDLDAAERFNARLERIGNIRSDGRPILGLDSRNLLETLLEVSDRAMLIPAHIWTPWFSVLGSKSGFDSIEECYRDLCSHICALETGLSSDPPMNWMVSSLDRYTLVSNSDAHSPGNIGREACRFDCELSYDAVMSALRTRSGFEGTLEFFPEEGKYHVDGHRACGVRFLPEESRAHKGLCPACGKELTLGVMYRVAELADRTTATQPAGARGFRSVLSLDTIVGEILQCGSSSKKVVAEYTRLIGALGPELGILLDVPLDDVRKASTPLLAEAISRMRVGAIRAEPGYDGEYGVIRVFADGEIDTLRGQTALAGVSVAPTRKPRTPRAAPPVPMVREAAPASLPEEDDEASSPDGLNAAQRAAATAPFGPTVVIAGPGTGKTRTLVERVVRLAVERSVDARTILAVTFSNRAAREMSERIDAALTARGIPRSPEVTTFHRLGLRLIREHAARLGLGARATVLAEDDVEHLLSQFDPAERVGTASDLERRILAAVQECGSVDPSRLASLLGPGYAKFAAYKRERGLVDFSDLLLLPCQLLESDEGVRSACRAQWPHILVDEFQDVNALQYRLLGLLAPQAADLFAIGDPDQAIYGFRGSDVRYFNRFSDDHPGARVVALNRSYRSTPAILRASAAVIAPCALADKAGMRSSVQGPDAITVFSLPTPASEAEHVVKTVEELIGGTSHFAVDSGRSGDGRGSGVSFRDIAVLCRTHAHGDTVAEAFARSGIPVWRAARRSVLDTKGIRAALAVLAAADAVDNAGLLADAVDRGICGLPRKASSNLAQRIRSEASDALFVLDRLMRDNAQPRGEREALSAFRTAFQSVVTAVRQKACSRAVLLASSSVGVDEEELVTPPWKWLSSQADNAGTVAELLATTALNHDGDFYDPRAEGISLMTLHASKGLEWRVVFIVGCDDGAMPLRRGREEPNMDEERRLLFVGMTRARERLFLSWPRTRVQRGERSSGTPSPFLGDIPGALKDEIAPVLPKPRSRADGVQLGLFD